MKLLYSSNVYVSNANEANKQKKKKKEISASPWHFSHQARTALSLTSDVSHIPHNLQKKTTP